MKRILTSLCAVLLVTTAAFGQDAALFEVPKF